MKKILILFLLCFLFTGCSQQSSPAQIAATTLPVYEFTSMLCADTPLTVTQLVTEQVSCLHDYSLNVRQVKAAEAAEMIVISGAGLEEFLDDVLQNRCVLMKVTTTKNMKDIIMRVIPTSGLLPKMPKLWPTTYAQA